ncbi:unnamed protein product, partial [marine sediment metagenome]
MIYYSKIGGLVVYFTKKVFIKISSIIFLLWFLIFPSEFVFAATSNQVTWQFSSADGFNISDSAKVFFDNNSTKLIPDDFISGGYQIWHDSHTGGVGDSEGWDIIVSDDRNYIYFCGSTDNGAGGNGQGFIVKVDQNLNEIWYQTYVEGTTSTDGMQAIQFDSKGNLITVGEYVSTVDGNAYFKIMKINANNGDVIWQDTQARGNTWVSLWDD